MNQSLNQLQKLSKKEKRAILGLMSGTSADGLDISVCTVSGSGTETSFELKKFTTAAYSPVIVEKLKTFLFDENAGQKDILRLQAAIEEEWVQLIKQTLDEWKISPGEIDLVASHGQTVLHLPSTDNQRAATWQLVDGDFLARQLGIITLSDFRKKHISAGFDGAPLAPLGERLLIGRDNLPAILLNLGGIANFTLLENAEAKATIPFSTDTGPASTLIDAAVRHYYPVLSYDDSGRIAASGRVNDSLLGALKGHKFYQKKAPKSTGPEEFKLSWVFEEQKKLQIDIRPEDLIATLTQFTAWGIAREIRQKIDEHKLPVYVSGGGVHNNALLKMIGEQLPGCDIQSSEKLGIPPEAKEAILFSVIANETISGEGWELPDGSRLTLGKISLPV